MKKDDSNKDVVSRPNSHNTREGWLYRPHHSEMGEGRLAVLPR